MSSTDVRTLPQGRRREQRRLERAMEARRRLADSADARHGGRAWINGEEVGGADPRFAHLSASFD